MLEFAGGASGDGVRMETLVGVIIVIAALVLLTALTLYCRGKIERLAKQNFPNARDAKRNLRNGE